MAQVKRSQKNIVRDAEGHLHLGKNKTIKRLFARNASGAERFAKSKYSHELLHLPPPILLYPFPSLASVGPDTETIDGR